MEEVEREREREREREEIPTIILCREKNVSSNDLHISIVNCSNKESSSNSA